MGLPDLHIVDNALPPDELAQWQERVQTGTQSTGLIEEDVCGTSLYSLARNIAMDLPLIHCLLFEIIPGHSTELHQDIGEYVVLFYPRANLSAPLRIDRGNGLEDIDVLTNRLVALNCTKIRHQQMIPLNGEPRYSIAFKFRLPTGDQ